MDFWFAFFLLIVLSLGGLLAVAVSLCLIEALKAIGWLDGYRRRFSNGELMILTMAVVISTWLAIEVLRAVMLNNPG